MSVPIREEREGLLATDINANSPLQTLERLLIPNVPIAPYPRESERCGLEGGANDLGESRIRTGMMRFGVHFANTRDRRIGYDSEQFLELGIEEEARLTLNGWTRTFCMAIESPFKDWAL